MTKQPTKIKVPVNTPAVLITLNTKVKALRQELGAIIEAGQAYARSVKLDPNKDYRFVVEGDKVYAVLVEPEVKQAAEEKE